MNFKIEDLSNAENEIVQNAQKEYGVVFDNATYLVSLTWNFLLNVDPKAWIFISFSSQVQKFLTLALLSTIRGHDVQAQLMLRQVLEASVLACYALHNPDSDEFASINSDGVTYKNEKVLTKACKWIEENYKVYSEKIKNMKEKINENSAHSNIISTTHNFEFTDLQPKNSFFDKHDELITKGRLWWIANISFGLLDLFSKVIHDFPLVKLVDDFASKMQKLGTENDGIKQELIKNPRFSRWNGKL